MRDAENPGGFKHIPALDGLRGLAILLVVFHHLTWFNPNAANGFLKVLGAVHSSGYVGVQLFFALSGYLITGNLLSTLAIPHFFKTFYARRTLRIFPLYYGVLLVLLVLTGTFGFHWDGKQYYFLTYTAMPALWATGSLDL